jgi:hypothetical protein
MGQILAFPFFGRGEEDRIALSPSAHPQYWVEKENPKCLQRAQRRVGRGVRLFYLP